MPKQILGTFQSYEAANSVKDAFIEAGFSPAAITVMVNRVSAEPPDDAKLEVGAESESGLSGLGRTVAKTIQKVLNTSEPVEGDGSEGSDEGGALLAISLEDDAEEPRVRALLESHRASDIEVAQPD